MPDVIAAHEKALEYGGGRYGIINADNLLGAIGRPYHGYHRSISRKAAALLHGVATSHGFVDANKRTAWLVTLLLLERSGYTICIEGKPDIDDIVVDVVQGVMHEEELVHWFKTVILHLSN